MKHKQLRIAATTFIALTAIIVPAILFIRSQAAQATLQTDEPSRRVLIEKNQIINESTFPDVVSTNRPPAPPDETTAGQPLQFASAIQGFDRREIKDAAFSAEVQIEMVSPLQDGAPTTRKTTYLIYRDSQGRTRRDQTQTSASSNRPGTSVINDPVADFTYLVNHRTNTVRKLPLITGNDADSQSSVVQPSARGTAPGFVDLSARDSQVPKPPSSGARVMQKEQLGQREIGGIIAEGTRFVRNINLGAPIEITTEEWYSVELQTIVAITISDPRFGRSEYRLTNIVRGDPSPTLFTIPEAYKVKVE